MSGKAKDKDTRFKLLGKRLAWRLGFAPFVNVVVRPPNNPGQVATDADVLGWRFDAEGSVRVFLADCRDTPKDAVERVLWVRGLAEFFHASEVMLLKKRIPDNARWMADQLGVACLDEDGVARVEETYRLSELKGPYFEETGLAATDLASLEFPKGSDYRRAAILLACELQQLRPFEQMNTLLDLFTSKEMARTLRPDVSAHVVLVWSGCVAFAVSLGMVLSSVRAGDLDDFAQSLRAAMAGGREQFEARDRFARRLLELRREPLPNRGSPLDRDGFDEIVERCLRFVARRASFNEAVRQLDVARHYVAVGKPVPPHVGGGGDELELGRKYARDLFELFARSNGLDPKFAAPLLPATVAANSAPSASSHRDQTTLFPGPDDAAPGNEGVT